MSLNPKEIAVLELLDEDPVYRNYFFNKVSDLKWFDDLKNKGHFNPQSAPGPLPGEQEGYYSIPWWNVLTYLEKISTQLSNLENERYIDELLLIIQDVSNFTDAEGNHIDNYHTWRSFVTILLNIPRDKIPSKTVELIPIWLSSKFDVSHVGSEIGLKLLPNFLSGEPSAEDISKAEKIINYLTDLKNVHLSAEREKLYNKASELKLLIKPYWLIKIFEENYKNIADKCSNAAIINLADQIKKLLIPDETRISVEDQGAHFLITLLSQEQQYAIKAYRADENVHEYVLMNKPIDLASIEKWSLDECSLNDFIEQAFGEISAIEDMREVAPDVLKKDLHNLYRNHHDKGTYSSFYDDTRDHLSDPLEVLTFGLKSILSVRADKHVDETRQILRSFFQQNFLFYPKMALYVIANHMDKYEDIFWEALESENNIFFYESPYFGDELRHVMEQVKLEGDQKEILKRIIAAGPIKLRDEEDKYVKSWKQERYHALIRDQEFKELYDALKAETGEDYALHPGVGEIKTRWGPGPSPLSKDDIFKKLTDKTLPAFLSDFKSTGFWDEGATVGGLSQLLKECVVEKPDEFINNLDLFADSGFIYVYEVVSGIRDSLKNKQSIDWSKVFDYLKSYIDRSAFWNNDFIVEKDGFRGEADHHWITGATTELIREASRTDIKGYSEEQFQQVEDIIFLILDKLQPEEKQDITDYVTYSINSPHGKTLIALIHHALLIARVREIKDDVKWTDSLKGKYDEFLGKNIIDSFTLLGRYLPNLYYLDKEWALGKVRNLNPEAAIREWEAFMDGYLSIGTVYADLYDLMVPHYDFGRSHDFKEKRDNEHLTQHIALGHLLGFDARGLDEEKTLINKVLSGENQEQVLDLVSFLWSNQRYTTDDSAEAKNVVRRIVDIWRWIYENRYKNKAAFDDNDKKIQSALSRLTVYLATLNDEYAEWLLCAAPYAEENYNSSFFIEYLDKFEDLDSIKHVGNVYMTMLSTSTPHYDKSHIHSIVEKLYTSGNKDQADEICNTYGERGDDFLRELYEANNTE
ncbi:MAG: hypothetical protein ISR96_07995 [Nitrospira sp.]|nr:hypothetical protein [Nitrospira sp.]